METDRQLRLQHDEYGLVLESLARRSNWPDWALKLVGEELNGRKILKLIHDYGQISNRRFAYLGMPLDLGLYQGRPVIQRRPNLSTDLDGFKFYEPGRIPLVGVPKPAILRALVNRVTMARAGVENAWSGWFTALDYLWLITHRDVINKLPIGTRFVAVVDTAHLEPPDIECSSDGPEMFVYQDQLKVELVVPVRASDLSHFTLVIEIPSITPAQAAQIYKDARSDLPKARKQHPIVPHNSRQAWPFRMG